MSDNIFDSDCWALVNTVNCVGAMGGGLARQFRERYPDMNSWYERECADGDVQTGKMAIYEEWDHLIVNFPTKDHWKDPSELEWIESGLQDLRHEIQNDHTIGSIAVPPLGCGLGGLSWRDVEPLIVKYLGDLPIRVDVYPPNSGKYTL